MKRKALPSTLASSPSASTFFASTKFLIVEDNGTSPQDISAMRAGLVKKKVEEKAGMADVLKATEVTGGRMLTAAVRDYVTGRM